MKRQDGHIPWVVFILPASILCTKGRRSETPTSCNCISNSFSNTAAEPRRLQKCVLRHLRKKKSSERGFWMLLSVGGVELVLELVGSGRKTFTTGDLCAEKLIIYNM